MCGIIGIADNNGLKEETLRQMRDTMLHRGPDAAGLWVSQNREVGLAHRRLSIIDLSEAGRQPMSDNEEQIWITYNGEIYNFLDIRKELEDKGYKFKSKTDTEVIIYAYREWGVECVQRFNGMFAFGIYDDRKKLFFLARDRIGKKPLYYMYDKYSGRFAFASEIKALLKDKDISREIDIEALNFYFTFGYIPGELCIFKAIRKLPPAHAMIYDINTGLMKVWGYWDVPTLEEECLSEEELLKELETLLEDAVRIRMISDVPLGAFLSGGIDSSLVVAMMSRVSDKQVKTFSIGFEDNKYNELPYARIVANYFGTDHHELIVNPDAFSILPELVSQFDEPFADSSMIPTYYVSKATKEHVTVALSGDGGDEMFGGYTTYFWNIIDYYISFIPLFLRKQISNVAEYIPEKTTGKKFLIRLKLNPDDAFIERMSSLYFNAQLRRELLSNDMMHHLNTKFLNPEKALHNYITQRKSDLINNITYADFKTYLPDDIMVKVDRTSMLVSLETRAPFLDYRIADFSFKHIHGNLKVRRGVTKYLLKKLAKKVLPKELDINRKWGFAVPISKWFRGPLASHLKEILLRHGGDFLNQNYIEKLLDEHRDGINRGGQLFTILVFCLWQKRFSEN